VKFPKTQVIVLANQKGGCGKTTSSISLAAAFNKIGYSVAIVDTDPQCNTTRNLGVNPDSLASEGKKSLIDAYLSKKAAIDIQIGFGDRFDNRLFLVPGNRNLTQVAPRLDLEIHLQLSQPDAAEIEADEIRFEQRFRLKKSIESLKGVHDVVIIDTPPNLDFIMTSALVAADWFIIPVFPSGYDLQGLETLTKTINKIREKFNPTLQLAGVLLGNFEKNTNLHQQIYKLLGNRFGQEAVFKTTIGHGVKMQELTVANLTVFEHPPSQRQADEFIELAKEMINRGTKGINSSVPLPNLEKVIAKAEETKDLEITKEDLFLEASNG
jgi:chromosome partitioning protein